MATVVEPHACDHVVQFYESDAELIACAGEYLRSAEAAVVIATEPHRAALAGELPGREDVVWLDAPATLERLTPHGGVEPAAFDEVIGDVVRTAAAGGRPVRAFGEVVALLWRRGDVADALKLETLWSALLAALPVSLYCAYPGVDDAEEFARICQAHTTVHVTWSFPAQLTAAGDVRHRLGGTLERLGHGDRVIDDAQVVVTELATNSVVHGHSAFAVTVEGDRTHVRIAVRDRSRALPALQDPSPERLSGRGLVLVSALSTRWGADRLPDGKVVWAELSA